MELTTPNHGCFVSRGCCFPREQTAGVHSNRCHHQNNNSSMQPKTKGGSRKTVNTGKDKTKVGVKPPTQKTLGFLKRKDLDVGDPDPSPDRYSHGPSVQAPAVHNVSVPPHPPFASLTPIFCLGHPVTHPVTASHPTIRHTHTRLMRSQKKTMLIGQSQLLR